MQKMIDELSKLYENWTGKKPEQVDVLPQSGSDRRYFRLYGLNHKSVIGTYGINIQENETFIYFSSLFKKRNLNVPEIFAVNEEKTAYLQEDFGNVSLLNILEEKGHTGEVYILFRDSLHQIARLQVLGDEDLDYKKCLTNEEFGRQAIMADL